VPFLRRLVVWQYSGAPQRPQRISRASSGVAVVFPPWVADRCYSRPVASSEGGRTNSVDIRPIV
jgi:hypothetical protein